MESEEKKVLRSCYNYDEETGALGIQTEENVPCDRNLIIFILPNTAKRMCYTKNELREQLLATCQLEWPPEHIFNRTDYKFQLVSGHMIGVVDLFRTVFLMSSNTIRLEVGEEAYHLRPVQRIEIGINGDSTITPYTDEEKQNLIHAKFTLPSGIEMNGAGVEMLGHIRLQQQLHPAFIELTQLMRTIQEREAIDESIRRAFELISEIFLFPIYFGRQNNDMKSVVRLSFGMLMTNPSTIPYYLEDISIYFDIATAVYNKLIADYRCEPETMKRLTTTIVRTRDNPYEAISIYSRLITYSGTIIQDALNHVNLNVADDQNHHYVQSVLSFVDDLTYKIKSTGRVISRAVVVQQPPPQLEEVPEVPDVPGIPEVQELKALIDERYDQIQYENKRQEELDEKLNNEADQHQRLRDATSIEFGRQAFRLVKRIFQRPEYFGNENTELTAMIVNRFIGFNWVSAYGVIDMDIRIHFTLARHILGVLRQYYLYEQNSASMRGIIAQMVRGIEREEEIEVRIAMMMYDEFTDISMIVSRTLNSLNWRLVLKNEEFIDKQLVEYILKFTHSFIHFLMRPRKLARRRGLVALRETATPPHPHTIDDDDNYREYPHVR